nr:MAG TPA: hypothetical protein [Caudoviricetes sp.]
MKYVTRTIEVVKAKVKITDKDGGISERECVSLGTDLLKELKVQYPDSKITIREMVSEENKYRMTYEDFVKYGELVK